MFPHWNLNLNWFSNFWLFWKPCEPNEWIRGEHMKFLTFGTSLHKLKHPSGHPRDLTRSSISSSFSLVFMVVYSLSSFFIFFWLILILKAKLITPSGSVSNLAGISFWKYCNKKEGQCFSGTFMYFISGS